MATVYSSDLIGTAMVAAQSAARECEIARKADMDTLAHLGQAEKRLTQALAEVRAARWGVVRRMPNFDQEDLGLVLDAEEAAITAAAGVIPGLARRVGG